MDVHEAIKETEAGYWEENNALNARRKRHQALETVLGVAKGALEQPLARGRGMPTRTPACSAMCWSTTSEGEASTSAPPRWRSRGSRGTRPAGRPPMAWRSATPAAIGSCVS